VLRSFAGGRLVGAQVGTGKPNVLALHGWARSHRDLLGVVAPAHHPPLDAIALDLPGFGAAAAPPRAWGSREYAELVAQVLPTMAAPVVVLGHSFGGRVGIELAAIEPGLVGGLVLTGVPLGRPAKRPALRFQVARRLAALRLISEARMEALRQRFGSTDYRSAVGVMREVLVRVVNEQYEEALTTSRCPVDLVWGEDDQIAPLEAAQSVVALLGARARIIVVPGAGHMTPLSAPEALRAAVLDRLASCADWKPA